MEVDRLGTVSKEVDLDAFVEFYTKNKQQMDKVCSRTLNKRFILKDKQGNRYKVIRRKGITRAIRGSERDTSKNNIVKRLDELTQRINLLTPPSEGLAAFSGLETDTEDEHNNDSTTTDKFTRSLYNSIQNQRENIKQKI